MKLKFKKLFVGDLVLAGLAFYLALRFRFDLQYAHYELFSKSLFRPILFVSVLATVSYVFEMYSLSKQRNVTQLLQQIIMSVFVSFLALSAIIFLNPAWMLGRGVLAISLLLFVCFQFCWHMLFRTAFDLPYLAEHIIIVGTGQTALQISKLIKSASDVNHVLKGFISYAERSETESYVPQEMILGNMEHLLEIVTRVSATKLVVIHHQDLENSYSQNLLLNCKLLGVDVSDAPSYFESVSEKLMLEHLDMNDLIYSSGFRSSALTIIMKRVFDVVLSVIGIVIMVPFFPIISLLVKFNSVGPVFYRQERVGYMGKRFYLYKFRTMRKDAELGTGAVWAQENDPRISPIGKLLRKTRLDELPQLFNVLVGNMSFIGPRPERPEFVSELQEQIPFYTKRHFIKPGITGWAQVKHPYGASIEESYEKLRYDLYYFKHMNLFLDTLIFLKTIRVVFSQFGGR